MSSFVKHPECEEFGCMAVNARIHTCADQGVCTYAAEIGYRPIFEERDTDQESRLDRRARARECK